MKRLKKRLIKLSYLFFSIYNTNQYFIGSNTARFFADNVNILSVDLNIISLYDVNFDGNDPIIVSHMA